MKPKTGYSTEQKAQVLAGYQERMSLRGAQRVFQIWRQTIMKWLIYYVEQLPQLPDTLLAAQSDDILEFDEAWSFVGQRANQRWLWTVLCRRTRQIMVTTIPVGSPLLWVTILKRLVGSFGKPFHPPIVLAVRTVIFGVPMLLCCRLKRISRLAKKPGRLLTKNAGIARSANA